MKMAGNEKRFLISASKLGIVINWIYAFCDFFSVFVTWRQKKKQEFEPQRSQDTKFQ